MKLKLLLDEVIHKSVVLRSYLAGLLGSCEISAKLFQSDSTQPPEFSLVTNGCKAMKST